MRLSTTALRPLGSTVPSLVLYFFKTFHIIYLIV
ncbi:MAG: hypothetical protein ACJA2S_005579 [Cyclobacteriaceae bacterium]